MSSHFKVVPFIVVLTTALATAQTGPDIRTATIDGQKITYEVRDGWAIVEGDIILGRASDLEGGGWKKKALSMIPNASSLWPKVGAVYQVPYVNDTGFSAVEDAVTNFNNTFPNVIQYVKRTTQTDYVEFNITDDGSNGCGSSSNVGRVGGAQTIAGKGGHDTCVPVLMHEMGHSVGMFHEQSRSDRDSFVSIQWANIATNNRYNYDRENGSQDLGYYDIGSTMHYGAGTFALDGNTDVAMSSIPVGIPFKEGGGYSAGDIDAIKRLYSAAVTTVTITSVPPGLQVSVDGAVVVTGTPGATFTWNIGDTHAIDVPDTLKLQTLNGNTYQFARWNDSTDPSQAAAHNITIAAGDGSALYPATSPKYTVYTASFRQLVPAGGAITTSVTPANAGTVTLGPDPVGIGGTNYYAMFQPLNLTATPAAGFSFYDWQFDGAAPGVSGAPTRTVRPGLNSAIVARFAQNALTMISTNPPGLPITVDGTAYTSPKNFALDYDAAWTANSSHSIAVASPLPSIIADPKARMAFAGWSDQGAQTHNITAGASAGYIATFNTQFPVTIGQPGLVDANFNACSAGTITTNPPSADAYFNAGSQVSLSVQPNTGWNFVGWQGDLTGNANPGALTVDRTKNLQAIFNTGTDPLAITGLAPPNGALNSPADLPVTIQGTGFTNTTQVCFIAASGTGPCLTPTFQGSNSLQVTVTKDLLTTAQVYSVTVINTPDQQCSLRATANFPVQ